MKSATPGTTRESVLARLMDDYLASCEAGQPLSAEELADRYPELAEDVAACLASLDFIRRAAASGPAVPLPTGVGDAIGLLGDFRILREVGRGGMGVVYEAEQISLARRVALKVLPFAAVLDPKQLQRFKNEALAAAQLDHPYIVDVLGVGCDRGTHFYAMRYIDGCTLADVIVALRNAEFGVRSEEEPPPSIPHSALRTPNCALPSTQAVLTTLNFTSSSSRTTTYYRTIASLIANAADALHHAHEQGVIHRDIKPSNLMLDQNGKLWITDFGLAHVESGATLTMTGDLMGTLRYMSPEQALGSRVGVDHRTDVYSLGATLYELLTLHPVFEGEQRTPLLHRLAHDAPKPPRLYDRSIPGELETITLKALAKGPSDRFSTADQLAQDLRRFLDNKPIRARRPGLLQVVKKWANRHAPLVILAAIASSALTLTLAVGAGLLWNERGHTQTALKTAEENFQASKAQQRRAEKFAADVRQRLYAADLRLAFQAWNSRDLQQTLQLLNRQRPGSGQEDLRGFEWHYLWRLCNDERLILAGHRGEVYSVAFSPDGKRLLTAGQDGTAKLWDAATGQELQTLRGHTGEVRCAVFSPDRQIMATASDDQTIKLWDAASGRLNVTLTGHTGELRCIAFSPDGRWLASGSRDDTAQLWDAHSGQVQAVFRGHMDGVRGVAFSPDGKTLATAAGDHLVKLWDVATFQQRAMLTGNVTWVCGVAFSPDGQTLANCAWGPVIKLWDTASGRELRELAEHTNCVDSVAFSPDGTTLLSASRDSTVRLWDIATGQPTKVLRAHPGPVRCAAFSPVGRTIATAGADGLVKLWDKDSQAAFIPLPFDWPTKRDPIGGGPMLTASFSPGGSRLAYFTSLDRELRILDLITGDLEKTSFEDGDELAFKCLEISPDGRTVATGTRFGLVQLWDLPGGKQRMALLGHALPIHSLAFSPDGRLLASGELPTGGGHHGTVRLWELVSGNELFVLPCKGDGVRDLVFSPDGRLLAATDGQVWRVADGRVQFELEGNAGPLGAIRFSPDGKLIATGDNDRMVKLWDASTGRLRSTMLGHGGNIISLAFSPDGRTLASGAADQTARLWHVATGQELAVLEGHQSEGCVVAFCLDGRALASFGYKELLLWPTTGIEGPTQP